MTLTMPLKPGKSKAAFSHNVEAEMSAGKPQKQALAIAYAVKRKGKKYSKGGLVEGNEEQMQSDDHFLSDEEAAESIFQDASEQAGDDAELEEMGQQVHPQMDNQIDDADENESRSSVLSNIMRKVRKGR